jgi:hypothetical protein
MSHANQLFGSRRRQFTAVLLIATAAVILLFSIQGSTARAEIDSTCEGGKVCVWTGTFYSGTEFNAGCGGGTAFLGIELKSAKNHCSVNVRIGWEEGGATSWKACMSPGGERPEPGRFNRVLPSGC